MIRPTELSSEVSILEPNWVFNVPDGISMLETLLVILSTAPWIPSPTDTATPDTVSVSEPNAEFNVPTNSSVSMFPVFWFSNQIYVELGWE